MHGEDLHTVGRHLDLAGGEPLLRALGGVEVVEQRGQRRDLRAPAVKSATTSANASRCAPADGAGTGGGLGVEQEQALGVRDRSVSGTDARARSRRSSAASRRIRAKPAGE